MQLRSTLQHAWATAVETVGTFTRQALKSSQGEQDWLRFFALMSSVIALREGTPVVPGTPDNKKALQSELEAYAAKLDVINRLKTYSAALNLVEEPSARNAQYFLLKLDPVAKQVIVQGFRAADLEAASKQYLDLERSIGSSGLSDAVLVSVDSMASLRKAYPNYFLDTDIFISALIKALR